MIEIVKELIEPPKDQQFTTTSKQCHTCKLIFPLSGFNASKKSSDGRHSMCRSCTKLKDICRDELHRLFGYRNQFEYCNAIDRVTRLATLDIYFYKKLNEKIAALGETAVEQPQKRSKKERLRHKRTITPVFVGEGTTSLIFGEGFIPYEKLPDIKKEIKETRKKNNNHQIDIVSGFIYVITHLHYTPLLGVVAMGSTQDYEARLRQYNGKHTPVDDCRMEFQVFFENRSEAEDILKTLLADKRVDGKEWYRMTKEEAIHFIKEILPEKMKELGLL
jgi:hypothetical protein